MKTKLITIVLLLIIPHLTNYAQKTKTPREFVLKVSQFNQFVKRFNYLEDFWGKEMSPAFAKKMPRADYLYLLFDQNNVSNADSVNSAQVKEQFVNLVVHQNYQINRISDSLYSVADCNVLYKGRSFPARLLLKQELKNGGSAWVIADVKADFIYAELQIKCNGLFIPPSSNELNYIHLKQVFDKKDSLSCFAYSSFKSDRLSIFFHMVQSGEVEFKHVTNITYLVFDIPGYVIQVREFVRNTDNSGWLIENIVPFNGLAEKYVKTYLLQ